MVLSVSQFCIFCAKSQKIIGWCYIIALTICCGRLFCPETYLEEPGPQWRVQKEKRGAEQESSSFHCHCQPATDTFACLGPFYPGADLPSRQAGPNSFSEAGTALIRFILVRAPAGEAPQLVSRKLGLTSRNCAATQL